MKVLYRIPYPFFFSQHRNVGGHIAHALGIVEGLISLGHDVTVVAHEGKDYFELLGARFIEVSVTSKRKGFISRQSWLLRYFRTSKAVLKSGNFDLIYTRYSTNAALLLRFEAVQTKRILEVNSFGSQRLSVLRLIDRGLVLKQDKVILVSKVLDDFYVKFLGVIKGNQQVVVNGVSSDRIANGDGFKQFDETKSTYKLMFTGLLKYDYGLETLIEAVRQVLSKGLDIRLDIVGDGPALDTLKLLSSDLDCVVFTGPKPFKEIPQLLRTADILVYSSSAANSFQSPIKLFEYMGSGIPILACETPQTRELLKSGELATLYTIDDAASLATSLISLINNYEQALEKSVKARLVTENEHLWVSRVREILE